MLAVLLIGMALVGCTSVKPAVMPQEMITHPEPRLALGPGDVLEIKFFNVPELNETQMIRPDGKITMQLLGEVPAQGKTPSQLQDELVRLYTPELRTPKLTVVVKSLANRRVYVGGHVQRPGLIEMPHPLTALEAIMQAGGFDDRRAEIRNVLVIRHKDGQRYGASLNFKDALQGKEFPNFYLEPQDIVYVPRTKITQVGLWIDQHINSLLPRFGLTFLTPVGTTTVGISQPTTILTPP